MLPTRATAQDQPSGMIQISREPLLHPISGVIAIWKNYPPIQKTLELSKTVSKNRTISEARLFIFLIEII